MRVHERVERGGVRWAQADVLIEVERRDAREVEPREFVVYRLDGGAGGEAQNRVRLGRHQPRDDGRRGDAGIPPRGQGEYFHSERRASTSLANRSTNCKVQRAMSRVGSRTNGVRSMAYSSAVDWSAACGSRKVAFARLRAAAATS